MGAGEFVKRGRAFVSLCQGHHARPNRRGGEHEKTRGGACGGGGEWAGEFGKINSRVHWRDFHALAAGSTSRVGEGPAAEVGNGGRRSLKRK